MRKFVAGHKNARSAAWPKQSCFKANLGTFARNFVFLAVGQRIFCLRYRKKDFLAIILRLSSSHASLDNYKFLFPLMLPLRCLLIFYLFLNNCSKNGFLFFAILQFLVAKAQSLPGLIYYWWIYIRFLNHSVCNIEEKYLKSDKVIRDYTVDD